MHIDSLVCGLSEAFDDPERALASLHNIAFSMAGLYTTQKKAFLEYAVVLAQEREGQEYAVLEELETVYQQFVAHEERFSKKMVCGALAYRMRVREEST